jgi:hypothetical protein
VHAPAGHHPAEDRDPLALPVLPQERVEVPVPEDDPPLDQREVPGKEVPNLLVDRLDPELPGQSLVVDLLDVPGVDQDLRDGDSPAPAHSSTNFSFT